MPAIARQTPRFSLPKRIRAGQPSWNDGALRAALADRLGALAGAELIADNDDTVSRDVHVYVDPVTRVLRSRGRPMPLCTISADEIRVYGLSDWDRHQVLAHGWGKLMPDGVLLHPPGNAHEFDVCWRIIQHAYTTVMEISAQSQPAKRTAWTGDLPRFSRTTLQ